MKNKNTRLIFQIEHKRLFGIGFVTVVDGVEYRGAVKVPKELNNENLRKVWFMLMWMMADPKNPVCNCVSGDEMLYGHEIDVDDYDSFSIFYHLSLAIDRKGDLLPEAPYPEESEN